MNIQCFHSSSAGNLYKISDGETSIMVEAGVDFKEIQKCFDFSLSSLACACITHKHGDHAKSWKEVSRYCDVYMLAETAEALGATGYKIKHYTPFTAFKAGTFAILPIPAEHDVPCCSFIIRSTKTDETVLFATDTAYLKYAIRKVHYAMIECNYQRELLNEAADSGVLDIRARDRIMGSHMELETTIRTLKSLDAEFLKEIHILHISARHADRAEIKRKIEREIGIPVYLTKE